MAVSIVDMAVVRFAGKLSSSVRLTSPVAPDKVRHDDSELEHQATDRASTFIVHHGINTSMHRPGVRGWRRPRLHDNVSNAPEYIESMLRDL